MGIYSQSIMWAYFQNGLRWRLWKLPQILYVTLYQLWYAQGYQEQASIESSVTTKVIRLKLFFWISHPWKSQMNEGQELSKGMNNGTRKQSMRRFCKIVLTGKVFLFPSVETNHNNEAAALRIWKRMLELKWCFSRREALRNGIF